MERLFILFLWMGRKRIFLKIYKSVVYMRSKIYLILVMLICLYSSLLSQGVDTRSCMNTFTNQTVSSGMSILGCTTLAIQNVTVASSGNSSLSAPAEVTINGPLR